MKKTDISYDVKRKTRNQVYRYINKNGRVSKNDIANTLRISMPTVLSNIKELTEQGLIIEVGEFKSTGGRKARAIEPIYNNKFAIGIDITQNHVGFALTDLSGTVLNHTRQQNKFVFERQYFNKLGELAIKFLEDSKITKQQFLGFGFSIPGIIDFRKDIIEFSHILGITNVSCDTFSQFIPYNAVFTNDANAAIIAEMNNASKRSATVYLSLSNSVGGAIFTEVSNSQDDVQIIENLYIGESYRSGEFGHMTLVPGGRKCYCGKIGCMDSYCSAKALTDHTDGKLEIFFSELENNNLEIQKIWDEYLSYLAIAVNNLRMAFDCQVIVGGYVGSLIEPYIADLQERAALLNTFERNALYIKPCNYKTEASALGAGLRLIEAYISTI